MIFFSNKASMEQQIAIDKVNPWWTMG